MFHKIRMQAAGVFVAVSISIGSFAAECPQFITTATQYLNWELLYQYRTPAGAATHSDGLLNPGFRQNFAYCTGPDGTMWLFGGRNQTTGGGGTVAYNDLWMLNPETKRWTFIPMPGQTDRASVSNSGGNYVDSGAKYPSSRFGALSWTDSDGNFYLFGGNTGAAKLGDVWKFDRTAMTWEWISNPAQQTVASITGNSGALTGDDLYPSARDMATGAADSDGNFWLFGDDTVPDLWRFDSGTKKWSVMLSPWRSYDPPLSANATVYVGENPFPGNRRGSSSWCDNEGSFYVFGGYLNTTTLNDFWKFNKLSQKWESKTRAIQLDGNGNLKSSPNGKVSGADAFPHQLFDMETTACNGRLYLFGWMQVRPAASFEMYKFYWEYTPTADRWRLVSTKENWGMPATIHTPMYEADYQFPTESWAGGLWGSGDVLYSYGGRILYSYPNPDLDRVELWRVPVKENDILLSVKAGETVQAVPMISDNAGEGLLSIDTLPTKGIAGIEPGTTHTLVYTASGNTYGEDRFSVKITKPGCMPVTKFVKVLISHQNPCDEATDIERLVINTLYNGIAVPNKELTASKYNITIIQKPIKGVAVVTDNGVVRYRTNSSSASGADSFTYKITTDTCTSDEKTVTLNIGQPVRAEVSTWELY